MKIAICGAAHGNYEDDILEKAKQVGEELAKNNVVVASGACTGYPHAAIVGASETGGQTYGLSPAKDEKEHAEAYHYPTDHFTELEYSGLGTPNRNLPLVLNSDAVIVIGGQSGSLIEFGIAFQKEKPIGVLIDSGGITKLLPEIAEICNHTDERDNVVFEKNPQILVKKLIALAQYL